MTDISKIIWLKNGRILKQVEDKVQIINGLPKKVYNMNFDPDRGEIYLEEFSEEFTFDFKVYGLESRLVNHIMKTYENTTSNLGILFNGTKGTGKTITAKIIANKTNLPVILVNAPYPGLADFISKIQCPCVLFFDEFEKNFNTEKGADLELLSIMDGVYNGPFRRVFLLTTNKLYINENLIGRPSRIRYRKSFGNLQTEVIQEYLDDNLINKAHTPEILSFIDSLSISTIDILKSVVEEANIHDKPLDEYKNYLNVESAKYSYVVHFFRGVPNSIEEFKKRWSRIGTTEKGSDGTEYVIDEDDVDIYNARVNTNTAAEFLQVGEEFGSFGTISAPVNDEGFILTEDDYGRKYVLRIENLSFKPSLYKGGLAY